MSCLERPPTGVHPARSCAHPQRWARKRQFTTLFGAKPFNSQGVLRGRKVSFANSRPSESRGGLGGYWTRRNLRFLSQGEGTRKAKKEPVSTGQASREGDASLCQGWHHSPR